MGSSHIFYKLVLIFVIFTTAFNVMIYYIASTCTQNTRTICIVGNGMQNPVPRDVNIVLYDETLCENYPDLRWLFYVHSAPTNREKRDLIRETWGHPPVLSPGSTRLVFMLGQTDDQRLQVCGQIGTIIQQINCLYTHMFPHNCTYTRTRARTHTHIRRDTYTQIHIHTYKYTYTHTHTHTGKHKCTQ